MPLQTQTHTQCFWETCCPQCYRTMVRVVVGDLSQYWCFRCYPVAVARRPIEEDGSQ